MSLIRSLVIAFSPWRFQRHKDSAAIRACNSPVLGNFELFSTTAPRISVLARCEQDQTRLPYSTSSAARALARVCARAKESHRGGATEREGSPSSAQIEIETRTG